MGKISRIMEVEIPQSDLHHLVSTKKKGIQIIIGTYFSSETLKYKVPKPSHVLSRHSTLMGIPLDYKRKIKPGTILFCICKPKADRVIVMKKCRNMNKATEFFDELVQDLKIGKLEIEIGE